MRDATKVVIGFGTIWGLFAGGFVLMTSFTLGANDTAPEVVALALYGLTILPSCLSAIWYPRQAGIWLLMLSAISVFGFAYQLARGPSNGEPPLRLVGATAWMLMLCAIPALIGYFLMRVKPAVRNEL